MIHIGLTRRARAGFAHRSRLQCPTKATMIRLSINPRRYKADMSEASNQEIQPNVRVTDVTKHYRLEEETIRAVDGVSMSASAAEFVAVMGPSGSGKTTLLHLIGGLDLPDRGRIEVDGKAINELSDAERTIFRRRKVGIVFQSFNLFPNLTALENVMLPYLVDGKASAATRDRAVEMLTRVRLENRLKHRPALMSGGEQQRVAIARALMLDPVLLLADEPTGNLDPKSSREVWGLMRNLCRELSTTVIMVTHEALAASQADRVLIIRSGKICGEVTPEGAGDEKLVADRYTQLVG